MSDETPDISPERTNLITLTEPQAAQIRLAMADVAAARADFEAKRVVINNLLAMVNPLGATGFDVETMTFYSEPQSKPEE